jgi:arsenical pump membrane protein
VSIGIWAIALASILCVLIRPRGIPEAVWAVSGAILLVIFGLIPFPAATHAIGKGLDVYLFLIGMMALSELARQAGVFDWLAVHAVRAAKGSPVKLFTIIYFVGILVTALLSNDATAVVLTPAVHAAVQAAKAEPLPYLMICAFIANAASFVLPISNPANLVVYGSGMPPLARWLVTFTIPSIAAIAVTLLVLRWLSRDSLKTNIQEPGDQEPLSSAGKIALSGIGFFAVVLLTASAMGLELGAPSFAAGLLITIAVTMKDRTAALKVARGLSWSVIPLVAGLFVIVEALNQAGAAHLAQSALQHLGAWPPAVSALGSAFGIAGLSNLMNNLPSGLIAGEAVRAGHVSPLMRDSILIGVDLGPNLSVSGSLATILWLIAIRRGGVEIGFGQFLRWGVLAMPPALALAVLSLLLTS